MKHWTLLAAALASSAAWAFAEDGPDFNRDVRPILSGHCFKCHGPDETVREAGLRLDQREAALKELDSGAKAILPGQAEQSELVRRIFSAEADTLMPPPAANKPLTDQQKQILKRWIATGANYAGHWSFAPPKQVPPLSVAGTLRVPSQELQDWPRGAIDAFILARLNQAGLQPSSAADRHTLARRASLDLIGLPPRLADLEDSSPDWYERCVDKLLASPRYGERWARKWLDLARYADTNGYEKDRVRSMWPYRDWVIRALNADLPFDQFTIEQLAGDMLPGATLQQRIATGFHRNTMINEEGGIDPLEFRFYSLVDRVNTTGTVWLGLTLGCVQCHTHKFDPIPHADYYRQMALLNNADEPTIDVPDAGVAAKRAEIERQIAELEADLPNRFPADGQLPPREHLEKKYAAWLKAEAEKTVPWILLKPLSAKSVVPTLSILPDGSVYATGDMTKRDVYELALDTASLSGITAIKLEALPDERLPKDGPGRVYYEGPFGDFWLSEITLSITASGVREHPGHSDRALAAQPDREAHASRSPLRFKSTTHSFASGKNDSAAAIDGDPQTGWSISGGQGRAHYAVFRLEQPLPPTKQLELALLFERYYAAGLGRFRIWATTDPRGGEARNLPNEIEQLLLIPPDQHTPAQQQKLLRQFLQTAPELATEREQLKKLRSQLPELPTTFVMLERPVENKRTTFRHHRGEFLQPKEPVEPELISLFPPFAQAVPHDRLNFARWLVSPANPLVGRVTMNRHWAAFFGTGIVRTTEDFGYQGEPPSHPELLDWLAVELIRRAWSIKTMHRLIVTSSTYRQGSAVAVQGSKFKVQGSEADPTLNLELGTLNSSSPDPQNRLLWHFPRVRLEAEQVRDYLLATSGLLSSKMGGASVFPPQPPGITSEGAYGPLKWEISPGEDRYRRGLYTFAKRTAPYAMFATFDGPSGEACLARREVSNTPLQALTMLNNPALLEAAQALGNEFAALPPLPPGEGRGEGAPRSSPQLQHQISHLFRRCVTRPPTDKELNALLKFYESQRQRLNSKALDAATIAGPGEGDSVERAAWTLVARAILNLDEVITKE